MIKSVIQLLRIPHYLKNLFVLLPLFFSAQFTNIKLMSHALMAFISFCMIASSIYVFNDLYDAEEDRIHPEKKNRPVASGKISANQARLLDLFLTVSGLLVGWFVNEYLILVLLIYKVINVLYTLFLKKIAIIDVMVLSIGFVLRLFAGSVSTGVNLSVWIIIMTFLLSLLIVFGKRRIDVIFYEKNDVMLRKSVSGYNSTFINYAMIMLSSVIIVAYIMYTVSPESMERVGTEYLFVTVFWVIAGILRYLQLLFTEEVQYPPVQLLTKDHPLMLILAAWFLNFLYFIYIQ